jgi:cell division protein FtsB
MADVRPSLAPCNCCCWYVQASAARSHEDGAAKQAGLAAQLKTARDELAGLKKEKEQLQRQLSDAQDAVKVWLPHVALS